MRFPRGRGLKLPKRAFKKNTFDPEKLSFCIVIAFLGMVLLKVFNNNNIKFLPLSFAYISCHLVLFRILLGT